MIQKIYSQIHPVSYINTHHDAIRFGKSWDGEKYINLNILRTEHDFSAKKKKLLACASDDTVWEAIIVHCAEVTFHVSAKMKGIYHL